MQREVLCTKSAHAHSHSCTAGFWLAMSFFAHHVIFCPQQTALQPKARLVFGSILFVWIMSSSVKSMPSGQSTISFCMSDKASSNIYYLTDLMAPLPGQSVTGMSYLFELYVSSNCYITRAVCDRYAISSCTLYVSSSCNIPVKTIRLARCCVC
jgi:hypothetical protein